MQYLWCFLLSYLIGSINPAYFIGLLNGVNVKKSGSANAGASNIFILVGLKASVLVFILDLLKTFIAFNVCKSLFSFESVYAFAIVGCIVGHVFPFYMHFNGGKGTACMIAAVYLLNLKTALIYTIIVLIATLTINYIIVVPFSISYTLYLVYYYLSSDLLGTILLFVLPFIVTYKHIENLKRIRIGKEVHFDVLYNKEKKMEAEKNA